MSNTQRITAADLPDVLTPHAPHCNRVRVQDAATGERLGSVRLVNRLEGYIESFVLKSNGKLDVVDQQFLIRRETRNVDLYDVITGDKLCEVRPRTMLPATEFRDPRKDAGK